MIFRQILRTEKGCASYIVGCAASGDGIVVDPLTDAGAKEYVLEAADAGLDIRHVVETHVHADHLSCGRELARLTGAAIRLHETARPEFPVRPLRDGDEIQAGEVVLRVLHTPGHTPESICLLGQDRGRADAPWFLLTGDTLFVGDVGRPDLILDGADDWRVRRQAEDLYDSLFDKILPLDDLIEIHPGHFGGSPCGGVHMSGRVTSTIGFERRFNLALQQPSKEAFVQFVLATLRPQPPRYEVNKQRNLGLEA
jgi:glyoxylase-like metal-dependent hydrolase (beta-lactamase superfamily II)